MRETTPTLCGLFTQAAATAQQLSAVLQDIVIVRHFPKGLPSSVVPHLWLVDLEAKGSIEVIRKLKESSDDITIVAFGIPGSEAWRDAARMNVYCLIAADSQNAEWQHVVSRAAERTDLVRALAELRNKALQESPPSPTRPFGLSFAPPSPTFPAALRSFDDVEATLRSLVEGVAQWTHVTRAGLFATSVQQPNRYTLRAAFRPLAGTERWGAPKDDPIPQWFQRSLQYVTRSRLERIPEFKLRDLLAQAMDDWGADVVIPLQIGMELAGWLFLGPLRTGCPFDDDALTRLAPIADYAATILDNALLYETAAFQRSLIETVLQAMPTGVVVVDENSMVRKCNEAACAIFGCTAENVLGQPVEHLSASLAEMIRSAIQGEAPKEAREWTEAATRRHLAGHVRPLSASGRAAGAVAFVHDQTVEKLLASKQEQVERAAFWTELAAAMSHEVRNPLVAIKTFAQLLPERYLDKEFRTEFAQTVNAEVGRLENIIEQIHQFAHPPPLVLSHVSVPRVIQRAIEAALSGSHGAGVWVETSIAEDLPAVEGDEEALVQGIAHVVTNAAEALQGRVNPRIAVAAHLIRPHDDATPPAVLITIQDNGPGIPPEIRSKVFSPFCTTKARGLGLGLPIAKRIVVDHGGQFDIETTDRGTSVFIRLPVPTGHSRTAKESGNPARKRR